MNVYIREYKVAMNTTLSHARSTSIIAKRQSFVYEGGQKGGGGGVVSHIQQTAAEQRATRAKVSLGGGLRSVVYKPNFIKSQARGEG